MTSRSRALLEVVRVPLLPTPVGDVWAGWLLVRAADPTGPGEALDLAWAMVAGVSLLAAGMAQNSLADARDDALRKPERPLPRGDLRAGQVAWLFAACTALALVAAVLVPSLRAPVAAIVVLTAAYHLLLKPRRVLGCLTLGGLRSLDVGLGVCAAGVAGASPLAWSFVAAYGVYVFGASLHASTDDEPRGASAPRLPGVGAGPASATGLLICAAVLLTLLSGVLLSRPSAGWPVAAALLLWAGQRVLVALRGGPPPRVTGAALSNLLLLTAAVAFALGSWPAGLVLLGLLLVSRRLLRVFPPS